MEILVKTVFKSMSSIKKPQRLFMMSLLSVLSVFQGRATYRNLSRYCPMSERRFSRWYARDLDFSGFNAKLLSQALPVTGVKTAAIDASFMSKSGQHTQGLGWFYNGSAGAAQRGLEISMISIVDIQSNTAYALDARQTLDIAGQSRTAYYAEQLVSQAPVMKSQGIRYVAADAYYSARQKTHKILIYMSLLLFLYNEDSSLRVIKPRFRVKIRQFQLNLKNLR